ncbi:MAG: putative membrane protein [Myxococcota bacterium]|jgi:uncharacterized membrane protein
MLSWLLSAHIIGIVMWAGTLMVLTRLMSWTASRPVVERPPIIAFQKRLLFGGALPGLALTVAAGTWMLIELDFGPLRSSVVGAGFHIKLTLVAALIAVHFVVQAKLQALEYPDASPGRVRALHGVVSALVAATIIVVLVVYPALARKKAQANLNKTDHSHIDHSHIDHSHIDHSNIQHSNPTSANLETP